MTENPFPPISFEHGGYTFNLTYNHITKDCIMSAIHPDFYVWELKLTDAILNPVNPKIIPRNKFTMDIKLREFYQLVKETFVNKQNVNITFHFGLPIVTEENKTQTTIGVSFYIKSPLARISQYRVSFNLKYVEKDETFRLKQKMAKMENTIKELEKRVQDQEKKLVTSTPVLS